MFSIKLAIATEVCPRYSGPKIYYCLTESHSQPRSHHFEIYNSCCAKCHHGKSHISNISLWVFSETDLKQNDRNQSNLAACCLSAEILSFPSRQGIKNRQLSYVVGHLVCCLTCWGFLLDLGKAGT